VEPKKHICVIGAGFAGLNCARKLAKHDGVRVTLIGQAQLYPVPAVALPSRRRPPGAQYVSFSLRTSSFRHANVEVKMGGDCFCRSQYTNRRYRRRTDFIRAISGVGGRFTAQIFSTYLEPTGTAFLCTHCTTPSCCVHRILAVLEAADREPFPYCEGSTELS